MFVGTHENKVDQKGRVSVPAVFRTVLAGQAFPGVFVFPSHRAEAIEGCGMEFLEQLNAGVEKFSLFSESQDDLATIIFAQSLQLPFDSTGRIQLPESIRAHAGITDKAAFVGKGKLFQIWEPGRLAAQTAAAYQRAREKELTIDLAGAAGGGR